MRPKWPDPTLENRPWGSHGCRHRILLPAGWTFTVELRDGELYAGRDPRRLVLLVPLTPHAFVLAGSLGEWLFGVENGKATRIVNLRKLALLVWTRVDETTAAHPS